MRSGSATRRCRAQNPRLIYASISGYGQTGPDRDKGGFDLIAQGVSGIMSITGEPGGAPVKAGVPLTDLGAGLFALVGILAAVAHRHRTGAGQHVDTSLVDAGVALSVWEATEYFSGMGVPQALGSAHRHDRAVSGDPLRRRLHHAGRGERTSVPAAVRGARPPGVGGAAGVRGQQRAACAIAQALADRIEAITDGRAVRALARAVRSQRHPVRPDQRLRAGLRRPPGRRARDGGGNRSSDAREAPDAGVADQNERHAGDSWGARRRG